MKLDLKTLLIATGGCLLLTLVQIINDILTPTYRGYRKGFELLLAWIIVAVAWSVYLVDVIRKHKKDKEEPWDRKDREPW